jgi:hypothetical protein
MSVGVLGDAVGDGVVGDVVGLIEQFIELFIGRSLCFLPEPGCPG